MGAINSHLSSALGIVKSAQTKIKTTSNVSKNPNRPYVLKDGTVVEDPSDIHLYNQRPAAQVQSNSGTTSGLKDSFERNQNEYSYDKTYGLNENSTNPFNRDDWNQIGVSYEEKNWNETTYAVERDNRTNDPEESYIDKHVDAKAQLWEHEFDALNHEGFVYGDKWENDHHKLEVDAFGYETGAETSVNIGRDGVEAELSANAAVYVLRAEYEATYGPGYTTAEASVGAEANINAEVNFNPMNGDASLSGGGEAFAGGKAEVATGVDGQYGKAEANAGVTYGVGVEAKADVGLEDGKVKAEIDLGATVGLGFDVGFEVEVDVKETAKSLTGWIPKTPW